MKRNIIYVNGVHCDITYLMSRLWWWWLCHLCTPREYEFCFELSKNTKCNFHYIYRTTHNTLYLMPAFMMDQAIRSRIRNPIQYAMSGICIQFTLSYTYTLLFSFVQKAILNYSIYNTQRQDEQASGLVLLDDAICVFHSTISFFFPFDRSGTYLEEYINLFNNLRW